jgi:hypothetical protein
VWGHEFEPAVDTALERIAADAEVQAKSWSNQHYDMSHLLRDIPTEAVERLLVKHWSGLGRSPLFIQAALYHGTARCRELAAASLAQIGQGADPFRHIGSFFGFFTQGLVDRLTDGHLDTLLPYLRQLDDLCLGEMLDYCRQFDHWAWAKRHLEPEMRRRVPLAKPDFDGGPPYIVRVTRQWFPTDEELLTELDRIELIDRRYRSGHLSHWWDTFAERGDPDERAGRLLLAWLTRNQSPARFVVAAGLVRERGKRRDLESLLKLKPAGDDPEAIRSAGDAEYAVKRRALD